MRIHISTRPFCRPRLTASIPVAALVVTVALVVVPGHLRAEEVAAEPATPSTLQVVDPFGAIEADSEAALADPFETTASDTPIDAGAYVPPRTRFDATPAHFQGPAIGGPQQESLPAPKAGAVTAKDPCEAAQFKP